MKKRNEILSKVLLGIALAAFVAPATVYAAENNDDPCDVVSSRRTAAETPAESPSTGNDSGSESSAGTARD